MTAKLSLLFSTCPRPQAEVLAELLIANGRAACVNIIPQINSVYRWQGQIHNDEEALLIIKTAWPDLAELFAWLEAKHPYKVPEIISLSGDQVLPSYLQWAIDQSGSTT